MIILGKKDGTVDAKFIFRPETTVVGAQAQGIGDDGGCRNAEFDGELFHHFGLVIAAAQQEPVYLLCLVGFDGDNSAVVQRVRRNTVLANAGTEYNADARFGIEIINAEDPFIRVRNDAKINSNDRNKRAKSEERYDDQEALHPKILARRLRKSDAA